MSHTVESESVVFLLFCGCAGWYETFACTAVLHLIHKSLLFHFLVSPLCSCSGRADALVGNVHLFVETALAAAECIFHNLVVFMQA